ncbi:hypothetical protein D1007_10451 [Hordeum vulgare]|nr:hypothetical protein D1007_10451 [Hordeum vulgare]
MPRPVGVSDAKRRTDVQRQEAVTSDRRRRLNAKRITDASEAAAAAAAVDQEEASRVRMMNPPARNPQAAWRGRQGVALPTNLSPTMPSSGYVPSPRYANDFNPNITFPHGVPQRSSPVGFGHDLRIPSPAFSAGLNTQYSYSPPAYSSAASHASSLCRGVLPFALTSSLQFNFLCLIAELWHVDRRLVA